MAQMSGWLTTSTRPKLSPSSMQVRAPGCGRSTGLSNPTDVAYGDSHVFAINIFEGSVTEIDASTGAIIATLSGAPYGLDGPTAEVSDGSHIWFLNTGANTVTEIDASTGAWIQTLSDPSYNFDQPYGAVFDGANIWVANTANNTVTETQRFNWEPCSRSLAGSQYGFDYPWGLASDGTDLWVTNERGNSITEVNASSRSVDQDDFWRPIRIQRTECGRLRRPAHMDRQSQRRLGHGDRRGNRVLDSDPDHGLQRISRVRVGALFAGGEIWTTTQTDLYHAGDCVDGFAATSGDQIQTLQG